MREPRIDPRLCRTGLLLPVQGHLAAKRETEPHTEEAVKKSGDCHKRRSEVS